MPSPRRLSLSRPRPLLWALWLLVTTSPAVAQSPDTDALLQTARRADGARNWDAARQACDAALKQDAELAAAYYWRGRAHFCLSRFEASVADFDQYVRRVPAAASRQWERGIACYYAGKYQAGADQFALYQTYHDNDVENSVWRYLCMARIESQGVDKAKAAILPIRNDSRPGMMTIYKLYKGEATEDDVLAAVRNGDPTDRRMSGGLFYARLYLGLYHEAQGNENQARRFIDLAADKHAEDAAQDRVNHFMYEVAVVHQRQLKADAEDKNAGDKNAGDKSDEKGDEDEGGKGDASG